jgi:hypothetical protein
LKRELESLIINIEPGNCYISIALAPKVSSETMYYYGEFNLGGVKKPTYRGTCNYY